MIIQNVKIIRPGDIQHHSWSRISLFQNVEYTSSLIMTLHNLSTSSEKQNAKKQASEIRHCLIQAKEYFDAAKAVSLATKPVLLYYSIMSLALAEILFKQTADSRLEKLRAKHNCHGLQMQISSKPKTDNSLQESSKLIFCKAQEDSNGLPRGTFEVWRQSAREHPVGAYHTTNLQNGATQTSYRSHLHPINTPPPPLPAHGISLYECLAELPYMEDVLLSLGGEPNFVRAKINVAQQGLSGDPVSTLIIHPQKAERIEQFGSLVKADAAAINTLNIIETFPSGYLVSQTLKEGEPVIRSYPCSICLNDEDIYFSCSDINFGEFGTLYLAMHMVGNFARYYPEIWLSHIEKSSPLATAIEELCHHSFDRLPLLTLSELTRTYYVLGK